MFKPRFCPWRACAFHRAPQPGFYTSFGSYKPKCRSHSVPRFRCKGCRRTFSRQTFRADYYDHKPHLNAKLFEYLSSGVGLRESSRKLRLSRHSTELKARKIGRHLRQLNLNLQGKLPAWASLQFDELESYEGRRNTRPLTLPMVIETKSRVILWAESAPIRPRGSMSKKRLAAIEKDRRRHGERRDASRTAIRRTLARAKKVSTERTHLHIDTDKKKIYPQIISEVFGDLPITHVRTSSKLARDVCNPLFPINQTEALARDLTSRLRRESWLTSKRRRWLDVSLHVFIAYRNLVRKRFNKDSFSAAEKLGWIRRRLRPTEVLGWRQVFGKRSIHPLARKSESIESVLAKS